MKVKEYKASKDVNKQVKEVEALLDIDLMEALILLIDTINLINKEANNDNE